MAKKNLLSRKRNTEAEIIGYTLPSYHDNGAKYYVDFYSFDPVRAEMRRKKYHLDKYRTKRERKQHADLLITTLTAKLRSGWNPWCDASTDRQYTDIEEILNRYVEYVEKTCRARTQENYRSRVNIFREYNHSRYRPIQYAFEFDKTFVLEFLDYILLDREANARTRNNYKGWLSALSEWMIGRKYISENPTEGITKLHEEPKKRQPLSKKMMRQLRSYLEEHDKYFLLACLMEYFTLIRPTELSYIRLDDIRIKERSIFVSAEYSKNKRDGYVGLNDTLIKLMVDLGIFKFPGSHYLFGKHFIPSSKREDADMFNKRWVQIRKLIGWGEEYQFYSLKDTGIRDLANSEGVVIARDQARHQDIATTNKYLGASATIHPETQDFKGAFEL